MNISCVIKKFDGGRSRDGYGKKKKKKGATSIRVDSRVFDGLFVISRIRKAIDTFNSVYNLFKLVVTPVEKLHIYIYIFLYSFIRKNDYNSQ